MADLPRPTVRPAAPPAAPVPAAPRRPAPFAALLAGLALLTALAWWWPNRPRGAEVAMDAERFASVSFAPFRPGQSPLRRRYPSVAEVEADLALVAGRARAIRTYASLEGDYDVAALAARHGLKLWQGAWLGADLARNEREVAALIAAARAHPDTVERVVVGNEVLLRRELPVAQLAAQLDRVRAAVAQPVTYADVWEFWEQFPELAAHVDVVTIHVLPYWEDEPRGVDASMAHIAAVVARMRALFPGKPIAIGEVGWPSRGRWREDAAPGRVEQALFLRRFIALAGREGLDYNLIEAFDQDWKYRSEGTVGAAWGLWTADRAPKFPLRGGVVEEPAWPWYAAAALVLAGLLLAAAARAFPAAPRAPLAVLAVLLGNALALAWAGTVPYAFDLALTVCAVGNLGGQALLAGLLLRRAGLRLSGLPVPLARTGAMAAATVRALLRGRLGVLRDWRGIGLDDLSFVFLWTAMLLQLLLLVDPRYRDPPLATFAVPLAAVAVRAWLRDLPAGGGGRAERVAGGALVLATLGVVAREGWHNLPALAWAAAALALAAPALRRGFGPGAARAAQPAVARSTARR